MIVVNVETTGTKAYKHSIISIGAIEFYNPKNIFYKECQMRKDAEITDIALQFNGFSREDITDPNKSTLKQIIEAFLAWTKPIEERTIAGENPRFDLDFLSTSAETYNLKWDLGYRTIDLHTTAINHYKKRGIEPPMSNGISKLNLDKIINYVGLPEKPKPDNALVVAKYEAEAFSRLLYGKNLLEEFKKFKIPEYLR